MDDIFEFLKEIAKGILREISAHTYKKNFLEDNKKSIPRRPKHKNGLRKRK
ncbi:hypothetical protein [Bacillus sp. AFS098217]|uniref:hypothetical protein n=1 Tax=Bacillus sp. AFS098217 TaxID=2033868 RepID=UPI0015CF5C44|nr:hypothetical protein [Bacillus sp. AFS098217]